MIKPLMPKHNYKTFALRQPIHTHTRKATCQEVDCEHFHNGWNLPVSGLDAAMLHAVKVTGRKYVEKKILSETYLVFEPGQQCFTVHRVPLERDPFMFIGRGHHSAFVARKPDQVGSTVEWVERFAEHQDNIVREINKG